MGDSIDNIKGVPGIGEKGARDLIAKYGSLEELLAHAAEVSEQALSRRPARPRRRCPAEPRARADPHRRAGDVRPGLPCSTAARRASKCFELFTRLGFRSLVMEYAPTAETVGKDYASSRHRRRARRARRKTSAARAASASACCRTARRRCARASPGWSFSTSHAQARLRARSRRGPSGGGLFGDVRRRRNGLALDLKAAAGGRQAAARGRSRPAQDRPRPEVRRDRARAPRHHAARPRDRHDDRELPARRDALGASARGARARAHRLQGAERGRCLRPRRQGAVVCVAADRHARSISPASAPTWRCSCRARCAICWRRNRSPTSTTRSSIR